MSHAMTTVGQGGAAYLVVGGTAITNASTTNWRIGGKHKVPSLAVNYQIAGQSSSTQHAVRVYPDGSLAFRTTATDRVRSAAGVISVGVDFSWSLRNEVGVGMTLAVNGADIGTFGTSSNFPINQLHRFSTTAASEVTTSEFFHEIAGVMQSLWNATNAPGTGAVWTSSGAITRTLTITAYTGVADSWWVFYNAFQAGENVLSVTATASLTVNGQKIGLGVIPVTGAAAISIQRNKVGSGQPALSANAALSIASNKIGLASVRVEAEAAISLYAGNVYVGEGTFSITASADVSLQSSKVGISKVQFGAAAAMYCTSTKVGNGTASIQANASVQLSAGKIGLGSVAVLASATIDVFSSNPAATPAPVTIVFVRTSSRYAYHLKTSSRYSYLIRTQSGGSRV